MTYANDPGAFNKSLATLMKGLKKDAGAASVQQNYKGTGRQAHRRQLFVRLPKGLMDIWLESGYIQLGGVTQLGSRRVIRYGEDTPEQVYVKLVEGLKTERAYA